MKGVEIPTYIKNINELTVNSNLPIPDKLEEGEVLVKVKACGVGFPDYLQAQGKYQIKPAVPFVLGLEFSGIIAKTCSNSNFKVNDKVFGISQGSLAEYVKVKESSLMRVPEGLSFEEASSILINYPTNYIGLVNRINLEKDQYILIHGSTGGVGLGAVQLSKMLGAKVIATGSNSEKLKFAKEIGADHIINLSEDKKWWETVKEITDGEGVDAVYDPVGLVDISMKCIKFKGKILIVGFAGGKWEDVAMNRVLLKNVSLVGLHINLYTKLDPETYKNCWNHLFELFSTNKLKPLINKRKFKLEEISEVFKLIRDRKSISKLVVTIDDDNGKAKL